METNHSPQTLTVGRAKFARNNSALISTLFNASGTASGLFRVRRNGVLFMRPTGEPFAFLVANPGQGKFFVSCRKEGSAIRYLFSMTESDRAFLGLAGLSYMAAVETAEQVWASLSR